MKILAAVEGFYNVSNIDIVNYITNNPKYVNVYNEDGSLNHDNICTYFEHNIDDIIYHVFPKSIGLSEELGFSIFNKSEIINEFNKYMRNV